MIEKFTSDVHMAPSGLNAKNIDLVVPSLGTVVGAGTLDAKNNMNFNLVATVNSALVTNAAGSMAGGARAAPWEVPWVRCWVAVRTARMAG